MTPGQLYPIHLDNLLIGNLFPKGHRLRVVVSGAFFPHFSRNLQMGESEHRTAASRRATVSLHHDKSAFSRLPLPVVAP
jgi:hypothetical protein